MIGFIKVKKEIEAQKIINFLKEKEFSGVILNYKRVKENSKESTHSVNNGIRRGVQRTGEINSKANSKVLKQSMGMKEGRRDEYKPMVNQVLLKIQNGDCFKNSKICFTQFFMKGKILLDVLKKLKFENISVKDFLLEIFDNFSNPRGF